MHKEPKRKTSHSTPTCIDLIIGVVAVGILSLVDLLLPHTLTFSQAGFLPYLLAILLLGLYRGYWSAGFGLLSSSVSIVFLLPAVERRFDFPATLPKSDLPLGVSESLLLLLGFMAIYLTITELHRRERRILAGNDELHEAKEQQLRRDQENRTLIDTVVQLRDRFAVDSSSITTLYHQIPHLYAQQLPDVYQGIIQSVQVMTKATRLGIYEFVEEELALICRDFVTQDESSAPPARLDLSTSLEGWVVRREQLFSIQRLVSDKELRRIDEGRVILCGPVRTGRRLWGVVTIEDMPFTSYNEYTEKAFELILALAGPAIDNAVPPLFAELSPAETPGELLRGYEEFQDFLNREVQSAESTGVDLALLLIEVANLEELAVSGRQEAVAVQLVEQLAELVSEITGGVAALFRFKERNQLAALLPSRHAADFSYISRHIVEAVAERAWNADGEAVFPEILIAFAQASESNYATQTLIGHAERLLLRQANQYRKARGV